MKSFSKRCAEMFVVWAILGQFVATVILTIAKVMT